MTEGNQQGHEYHQYQSQDHPIGGAPVEHSTHFVEAARSHLDAVNVLVLLLCIDSCRGIAVTLLHIDLKGLRLQGLVGIGRRIIIGKLHGRNLILTLISRNHQEVVNHVALHAIGGQLGLIRNLGVVLIEILGEVHYRLLDELQVAGSTHHHAERHRIVGLNLGLVELR